MTHPLPLRPLPQRNPAWRLYGDALIAIDARLSWRGGPPTTVRCLVTAARRLPRAAPVVSVGIVFGAVLPAARA